MITASHNPALDNGVKIIENTGHMLDQSLEKVSEKLVNADAAELPKALREAIGLMGLSEEQVKKSKGKVLIGRDTRESSKSLAEITM